jgi:hypothetical protein
MGWIDRFYRLKKIYIKLNIFTFETVNVFQYPTQSSHHHNHHIITSLLKDAKLNKDNIIENEKGYIFRFFSINISTFAFKKT